MLAYTLTGTRLPFICHNSGRNITYSSRHVFIPWHTSRECSPVSHENHCACHRANLLRMSHTVHKPDYPTYITVFTQYKILKITLKFFPPLWKKCHFKYKQIHLSQSYFFFFFLNVMVYIRDITCHNNIKQFVTIAPKINVITLYYYYFFLTSQIFGQTRK